MTRSAPDPAFTTEDLALFGALLFEIRGPHWRDIQLDIGVNATDLYHAIAARARALSRQMEQGEMWVPDEIDLATIRVVGRSVLRRDYEPEFKTISGHTFSEVEALCEKAEARAATTEARAATTTESSAPDLTRDGT